MSGLSEDMDSSSEEGDWRLVWVVGEGGSGVGGRIVRPILGNKGRVMG